MLLFPTFIWASDKNSHYEINFGIIDHGFMAENVYFSILQRDQYESKPLLVWKGKYKWLRDLKVVWREKGRYDKQAIDAVSGATRAPGNYQETIILTPSPGSTLIIEAAREEGSYEKIVFDVSVLSEKPTCKTGGKEIKSICIRKTN